MFDVAGLRAEPIREETDYGGLRLRTSAQLAGAKIPIVIDIGFGDATEPGTEEAQLPVLLDLPKPTLRVYARETVIAEKFRAIVMLGMANTRLKDYYDIWFLAQDAEFDGQRMTAAIAGTFGRRKTPIPTEIPDGLSEAFAANDAKQKQWQAFVRDPHPSRRSKSSSRMSPAFDAICRRCGCALCSGGRVGYRPAPTSFLTSSPA